MKKYLMILVAVVCFGLSTNAGVVFRTTQKVCYGEEQVFFYSSGKVVVTTTTKRYEGTYNLTDGGIAMVLNYEGEQIELFAQATTSYNNSYLDWIIFDGKKMTRCN